MESFPRCQIDPLPNHETRVVIDGKERTRWHFGPNYPRPFFYPFIGPSGVSLTRIGHPGSPSHEHHRSIWFAHNHAHGVSFWTEQSKARITQRSWFAYEESNTEAILAVQLDWKDGHDPKPLIEQELIVSVWPGNDNELFMELQTTLKPTSKSFEFGKTNFGFLSLRVEKRLSEFFGNGRLTDSEGRTGEQEIFGKRAAWMDYSGAILPNTIEGITYYDHPLNPNHPTHWHVRSDGWMCASVCMDQAVPCSQAAPLTLRYLLHAHRGAVEPERCKSILEEFSAKSAFIVSKGTVTHRQYEARRIF